MKIDKKEVLQGMKLCAEMESIWHNGRKPSCSFKLGVAEIREILGELLKLKNLK